MKSKASTLLLSIFLGILSSPERSLANTQASEVSQDGLDQNLNQEPLASARLTINQCFDFFARSLTSQLLSNLYADLNLNDRAAMQEKWSLVIEKCPLAELRNSELFISKQETFDQCLEVLVHYDEQNFYEQLTEKLLQRIEQIRDDLMYRTSVYYRLLPIAYIDEANALSQSENPYYLIELEKSDFAGNQRIFHQELFPEFDIIFDDQGAQPEAQRP